MGVRDMQRTEGEEATLRTSLVRVFIVAVMGAALCLSLEMGAAFGAVEASMREAEILHDLAEEYASAEIENSTASSVGDVRGNPQMNYPLLKRYLFLHPPGGKVTAASATYRLALPALGEGEELLFLFAVGLKPGWREADKVGADGVIFRVLVYGRKSYEQPWDKDGWCFSALDLSGHAGETIRLTLVCDRNRNNSADWAMWGDPRVVLLRRPPWRSRPSYQADLLVLRTSSAGEIGASWPALGAAGAGVLRPLSDAHRNMLTWFPSVSSAKGAPRLPLMKLADGAIPALTQAKVVWYAPEIELVSVGQSPAIVTPYDRFRIVATVKNVGEGTLGDMRAVKVCLGVPAGFVLAERQTASQTLSELKPAEEKDISWRLLAPHKACESEFALRVGVRILKAFDVIVSPRGKRIDYGDAGSDTSGLRESEDSVVAEKGNNRLVFVRDKRGFLYGTVLLKTGERWRSLGRLAPLAELSIKLRSGGDERIEIQPARHTRLTELVGKALAKDELAIRFSGEFYDDDGVKWRFQQSFALRSGCPWIEVETSLAADAPRDVVGFQAPKLLAGDGSFGTSKDQAIFPGLEYLGKDEPSSSTRDIAFPLSRRYTPHPLRVTIPLMAVREGSAVVGLSWDVHQKWHGDKEMPTPLFSSPNRFPAQDNHLMALLVPSVPEFINEGTLDSKRTLSLAANRTLSTRGSILLLSDVADISDALAAWVKRDGLPEIHPPRSFEEEIELCRHGFMESIWSESAGGWSHCVGWAAAPYPGYCTLLNMDYFLSKDDEVRRALRERIDLVVSKCLERFGRGSLWRRDACHILTGELPFIEGRMVESMSAWERATDRIVARQSPDGSWRWRPSDQKRASLGKPGDITTSGICARSACNVLREAIVTGNRKHIEAALKALDFLDRYAIPTGAQEWECPIHAPDVLAAAYAVRAFVLAHEITGDDAYLKKAVFWARTGIPFHYLWDRGEEMPQMLYAGIPIFGATFYTHSWLGRPVQWCSLVYAYSLLRLSRYDDSLDWHRLAEGITVSAMWQQYTEGKSKGCYPDSWDLLDNHPNPADINPENILLNILALKGYDPGLKHRVLSRVRSRIFITSIAEMLSANLDGNGGVAVRLKLFPRAKSYLFIAGLPPRCRPEVLLNGGKLTPARNIDNVASGWLHVSEKGWLVIAITHSEEPDTLEIYWPLR